MSFNGSSSKESKYNFHAMAFAYETYTTPYIAYYNFSLSAARNSALYGGSSTVQPNAGAVQYLIKY